VPKGCIGHLEVLLIADARAQPVLGYERPLGNHSQSCKRQLALS
jgi:hypothetical protein